MIGRAHQLVLPLFDSEDPRTRERLPPATASPSPPRPEPGDEDGRPVVFVRNRRARRYILRLGRDGRARVTVPRGGSEREARRFLSRHADWLDDQRRRLADVQKRRAAEWQHGKTLWFRGVRVMLGSGAAAFVEAGSATAGLVVRFADVVVPVNGGDVRSAVQDHLRTIATSELPPRVASLAAAHRFEPGPVTIRNQRSRWGSCSPKRTISLNWRLLQMPESVCDYVILHELAHLRYANHGRRFWSLVARICPWYRDAERWLRRHGRELL